MTPDFFHLHETLDSDALDEYDGKWGIRIFLKDGRTVPGVQQYDSETSAQSQMEFVLATGRQQRNENGKDVKYIAFVPNWLLSEFSFYLVIPIGDA